jgi:Lon protease-like protein
LGPEANKSELIFTPSKDALIHVKTTAARSDCPVCLESFVDTDESVWYVTSCGHRICKLCMDKCLHNAVACPICRHLLLNEKALLGFPKTNLLGLFILNPTFFAVPGSTVLLRVFEPRYLILVKRCIATDTCFGLQAGFKAKRGVLISIKRHRELPEGHIIMEGLAVARYEAFDSTCEPEEEPETFGLYQMQSKIAADNEHKDDETREVYRALAKRAEELLQLRIAEFSRYDKEVILKICGVCPSSSSYEFSFWLLGALYSPIPKADILFNKDVVERMKFCLKLLEDSQPFECLMEDH